MKLTVEYKVTVEYESDTEVNKEAMWNYLFDAIEHERVEGTLTDDDTSANVVWVEVIA